MWKKHWSLEEAYIRKINATLIHAWGVSHSCRQLLRFAPRQVMRKHPGSAGREPDPEPHNNTWAGVSIVLGRRWESQNQTATKNPNPTLGKLLFLESKLHVTDQLVNTGWSRSRCALHGSQARRGVSRVDSISNEKIEIHFSKGILMLIFPSMFILSVCHIQSEMASVQKTSQPMAKRKYFLNGTETSVSLQRPAGYMAATFIYLFILGLSWLLCSHLQVTVWQSVHAESGGWAPSIKGLQRASGAACSLIGRPLVT